MRAKHLLVPTLTMALLSTCAAGFAQYYPGPPRVGYGNAEEALEQRGFQDGIIGAEHDYKNRRRPDVNNRDEYRDPRFIPGWARHEYREGFRRGYAMRAQQIYGPPVYGYGPGRW